MLDSVRDIEGFPIGKDEDILAVSEPPYYTACPNPYIKDFLEEHGKTYDEKSDDYHREPFVGDIHEGRNDPIYNAHSYHTKVPHKAIMKFIEHYTEEGDIVFDGFCGTGMTGVAAQLLNRKAILSDLSPIATFIACNYNNKVDADSFGEETQEILKEVEKECGWMYETDHFEIKNNATSTQHCFNDNDRAIGKGKINYTIWSDVFICPYCGDEFAYWEAAFDKKKNVILDAFKCLHCHSVLQKRVCKPSAITFHDEFINKEITQGKKVPVQINYIYNKKRFNKYPDSNDLDILRRIEKSTIPYWVPSFKMMFSDGAWGDIWRSGYHFGITHCHHFYTKRNLWITSSLWHKGTKNSTKWAITSILNYINKKQSYTGGGGGMPGVLYIASLVQEKNIFDVLLRKEKKLKNVLSGYDLKANTIISTQSITSVKNIPDCCIDYIFTDPPFGANIMYSEGSFLWESWLKVFTNNKKEAIINNSQNKSLADYYDLMLKSFQNYYRIIKPNRWITVEFNNKRSSVWNSIQNAMSKAGFVVANVAVLDKKQGSFKQVTSSEAVKIDLIISAYKPKKSFEKRFIEFAGSGLEEEFIEMHLSHLLTEPSIERTEQMLYSKLLAFYVQRSYTVRYDASTFYKMLRNNFSEEDGYWFNLDQIKDYREYKKKMRLEGIDDLRRGQINMFVSDEKSALIWLHTFLNEPKDFKTIHPDFTKIANVSGDQAPDLHELLANNFILEGDKYRRPKTNDEIISITQKREKELLREFEVLLLEAKGSKKKIKECRKQSVIFGFEHCYKKERFQDILTLAKRLDKKIIENDSELNEFIEVAELKVEGF